jgi:hypothetical protein
VKDKKEKDGGNLEKASVRAFCFHFYAAQYVKKNCGKCRLKLQNCGICSDNIAELQLQNTFLLQVSSKSGSTGAAVRL